jgi:hypothetical protein
MVGDISATNRFYDEFWKMKKKTEILGRADIGIYGWIDI